MQTESWNSVGKAKITFTHSIVPNLTLSNKIYTKGTSKMVSGEVNETTL